MASATSQGQRTMKLLAPKRNPNGTTDFPNNPLTKPFVGRSLLCWFSILVEPIRFFV
jgi:hypothetical protein